MQEIENIQKIENFKQIEKPCRESSKFQLFPRLTNQFHKSFCQYLLIDQINAKNTTFLC